MATLGTSGKVLLRKDLGYSDTSTSSIDGNDYIPKRWELTSDYGTNKTRLVSDIHLQESSDYDDYIELLLSQIKAVFSANSEGYISTSISMVENNFGTGAICFGLTQNPDGEVTSATATNQAGGAWGSISSPVLDKNSNYIKSATVTITHNSSSTYTGGIGIVIRKSVNGNLDWHYKQTFIANIDVPSKWHTLSTVSNIPNGSRVFNSIKVKGPIKAPDIIWPSSFEESINESNATGDIEKLTTTYSNSEYQYIRIPRNTTVTLYAPMIFNLNQTNVSTQAFNVIGDPTSTHIFIGDSYDPSKYSTWDPMQFSLDWSPNSFKLIIKSN